jgi:hypothetical protein
MKDVPQPFGRTAAFGPPSDGWRGVTGTTPDVDGGNNVTPPDRRWRIVHRG